MNKLTDFQNIRNLLKSFRIWNKKRLGQHFLIDEEALQKMIKIPDVQAGEHITEIGAGHGVLTLELLKKGALVDAIEIDDSILPVLSYVTKSYNKNLVIHHQHILGYQQTNTPYKVVANIPYQLTSPILRKFLPESDNLPISMTLLMQKEVAEKIVNPKKKSLLSLIVEVFGEAEIMHIVPEDSFFPPPKVKSAILHIKTRNKTLINIDKKIFYAMLKNGFSSPRKKLKNVLGGIYHKSAPEMTEIFKKLNIDPDIRAEKLEIKDWENLAKVFYKSI